MMARHHGDTAQLLQLPTNKQTVAVKMQEYAAAESRLHPAPPQTNCTQTKTKQTRTAPSMGPAVIPLKRHNAAHTLHMLGRHWVVAAAVPLLLLLRNVGHSVTAVLRRKGQYAHDEAQRTACAPGLLLLCLVSRQLLKTCAAHALRCVCLRRCSSHGQLWPLLLQFASCSKRCAARCSCSLGRLPCLQAATAETRQGTS